MALSRGLPLLFLLSGCLLGWDPPNERGDSGDTDVEADTDTDTDADTDADTDTDTDTDTCVPGDLGCECTSDETCTDGAHYCVSMMCTDVDPVEVLASDVQTPGALAVDTTKVYFSREVSGFNEIVHVPHSGGTPATVFSGPTGLWPIDAQGDFVYYVDTQSSVGRYKADASQSSFYTISTIEEPAGIDVAGQYVYFHDSKSPGRIVQTPLDMASEREVIDTYGRSAMYARVDWLYFSDLDDSSAQPNQTIERMETTQGAVTTLRTNLEDVRLLASDDDQVFSVTEYNSRSTRALTAHDISTAADVVLRVTSKHILAVEVDATHVYWMEGDQFFTTGSGEIYRTLKSGDGPTVLLVEDDLIPVRLRLQGDYLYWTSLQPGDYVGTVNRRRK
ncbi:MAG: DUF5050 domain-containing protein [Proteobacteria bacterium]|nr:DUF5050 domain-containing protein [Pseudomonadota bacterium]